MSIIILIKFVSPQHRRRRLAPAPHCLPRRTHDPAVVSPRLPTASLDAPKILPPSRPAPHCLPRRIQDPTAVSPRHPTASLNAP
jgi:hypothetical protein